MIFVGIKKKMFDWRFSKVVGTFYHWQNVVLKLKTNFLQTTVFYNIFFFAISRRIFRINLSCNSFIYRHILKWLLTIVLRNTLRKTNVGKSIFNNVGIGWVHKQCFFRQSSEFLRVALFQNTSGPPTVLLSSTFLYQTHEN